MNLTIFSWANMLAVSFPLYVIHLNGTELIVGLTTAGVSLAALFIRPYAGWLMDNRSRSGLLRIGILLMFTASVLFFTVPILAIVIPIRIFSGLVFSGVTTSTTTNAADFIPTSRFGEGIGILGMSNTFATAMAPAIALAIVSNLGFPQLFIMLCICAILSFIMERGLKYRVISDVSPLANITKVRIKALVYKDAIPASIVMLFTAAPFGGIFAFIALYGELYGLGAGGVFFTLVAVGTGSTRIFAGRIVDTKGEKPLVIIAHICIVTTLILLQASNSTAFYIAGFFAGAGIGLSLPALQAMSMRIVPKEKRGAATGTFLSSFDLSGGVGGLVSGFLVTWLGYRQMFASLITFVIIACLIYFLWASKTPSAFKKQQPN